MAQPQPNQYVWKDEDFHPPNMKLEVPDWRIYKIKGIPELEYVESTLASKGLKDPWLRNEVWRYSHEHERRFGYILLRFLVGRKGEGLWKGLGLAAAVITTQHIYYHWRYGGRPPHVHTFFDLFTSHDHH